MSDLSWMRPKLAALCGYTKSYEHPIDESDLGHGEIYQRQGDFVWTENWRPDEDVAQAVRCIAASKCLGFHVSFEDCCGQRWDVSAYKRSDMKDIVRFNNYTTELLPRAIVLAIAAAMGWQAPGKGEG